MPHHLRCRRLLLLAGTVIGVITPVQAQVLNAAPQSIPFHVLAGTEFKIEGEDLLIVSQKDILAVVEG